MDLHFQFQWRGTQLTNIYILVCDDCLDIPTEQNRAIVLPADPTPIYFPSVEQFEQDETDYRTTLPIPIDPIVGIPVPAKTALRVTEDCQNRITQPVGAPVGLEQSAVMPWNGGVQQAFGVPLNVLSVVANGTATVQVTCSKAHGLETNSQVSIAGLERANGFYSVTVLTATAFTYMTANNVAAGSLLTPTTRIVTALVGLQYGAVAVPQVNS